MKKITIPILFGAGIILIGMWAFLKFQGGSESAASVLNEAEGESIVDLQGDEKEGHPVKQFDLTASEEQWEINQDTSVQAWTYNQSVPGQEIRVKEGDYVKVHLKNNLDVPVTIHWHGVVLPNKMDGVPGITQDAVLPGEEFTYEFLADNPGTYWYHSHQHSSKQVDKGLYGAFIVEEDQSDYSQDHTFILDEWAIHSEKQSLTNMGSMMTGGMSGDGEADTKAMYDTLTINGKNESSLRPIDINEGESARLRFVNAGYQTHVVQFTDQMRVIAVDGEDVTSHEKQSKLEIAPGERIDVEWTNKGGTIRLLSQSEGSKDVRIPFKNGSSKIGEQEKSSGGLASGTSYKSKELLFDEIPENPDVTYKMNLNMGMNMGEGMVFQINEDTFPDTPPIQVKEGDLVKVELKNTGMLNHPMHLHGHRFQVVSKNGKKLNNPVVKDLINVKPGETYEVYFKANNKGEWLFHCHDNNHADRGMVTIVDYKSVYSPFEIGGGTKNAP
ncbi:multicopper oxidase family protein [Pontibacillus salipaludis]|uniref:Oxidase (Copper-binding protein) n=1 Tax=Pontibacillus salipaludis TaxID=1697394 RepID=A0ABQ1Q6C1_9BACI|nr:multicopper oxidase family protein [Pontibacillus salipaludis]GGD13171.1 putative oxidase (copper-binding protein) [Pontibacillus salipaludis]